MNSQSSVKFEIEETSNFFKKKEIEKKKREEEEERQELLQDEQNQAHRNKAKRMMSRDDLMHLLQDSIDKSSQSQTKGDKFLQKHIERSKKYIENHGKEFEENEKIGMPKRQEHNNTKFWKDDIPQKEFEEMHTRAAEKVAN